MQQYNLGASARRARRGVTFKSFLLQGVVHQGYNNLHATNVGETACRDLVVSVNRAECSEQVLPGLHADGKACHRFRREMIARSLFKKYRSSLFCLMSSSFHVVSNPPRWSSETLGGMVFPHTCAAGLEFWSRWFSLTRYCRTPSLLLTTLLCVSARGSL